LTHCTKKERLRKGLLKERAAHRVLFQSIFVEIYKEGNDVAGRSAQVKGMTVAWRRSSNVAVSETWESFIRSGLKLELKRQEPPHTGAYKKMATNVAFLLSNRF
jgi:hypothetical protein